MRVSIIDMDTYKYLAKSDPLKPGVYNKESVSFIDSTKQISKVVTDFILPFSTQMYDLRIKGMNLARWEEEFVVNEYAH